MVGVADAVTNLQATWQSPQVIVIAVAFAILGVIGKRSVRPWRQATEMGRRVI